jgi:hypothetical protein
MMERYKAMTYNVRTADKLTAEEKEGKFPLGVLHQAKRPEFLTEYDKLIESLREPKGGS